MIKSLKHLRRREWLMIALVFVLLVIQVNLDLLVPDYMFHITQLVQTEGTQVSAIVLTGGSMLLASLGSVVASVFVGFLSARIGSSLGKELRFSLFEQVQNFSMEEMNQFSTASLITRSTNDVTQVQNFIAAGLQVVVKAPLLAIFAVFKIAGKSWQWTSLVGGAVIFLTIVILVVVFAAIPKFKKVQQLTDRINLVTQENLTGLKVVRAYNAEEYQEEKFMEASSNLANNNLFGTRIIALMPSSLQFAMSAISLGVYWIGAYLIQAAGAVDKLTYFGDMIVFSSYAMQIISAFMLLSILFLMLPKASVSARRINDVLDVSPSIVGGSAKEKNATQGAIEFRNVSFRYPDAEEYVLKDVSFLAKPGETTAFIGSTGSGKSTLINLIPRFYDATEGSILLDGTEVKEYPLASLYNKLGYVSQKAVLFSGTVKSNIDFGEGGKEAISEEEVKEALAVAQGLDFVNAMPQGIHSAIAQEGTNLSGGQKQRVSIARAVARDPEVLIFDDSFSALDYKTDQLVRRALNEATQNTTKLIVAQRIGTILEADRIIVLDKGEIVGVGKHKELLKTSQIYREIAESQLPKEELYGA